VCTLRARKLQEANLFEFPNYHDAYAIESAAHRTQLRKTNMELELGKSEAIFTLFPKLLPQNFDSRYGDTLVP
jgi:hypothetical protein